MLLAFGAAVVRHLLDRELLEIEPDSEVEVARFVATHLGQLRGPSSLISSVSAGLLACPEVLELYADDQTLKLLIDDFGMSG